jgi:acetyl-CoA/propionyl-CoA carboxylase carboxyl transferase subunit
MTAVPVSMVEVGDPSGPVARLGAYFDPGSVRLVSTREGTGVVAATGTVDGTRAVAFACDPAVKGGAMGADGCREIVAAYDRALADGCPITGLWHSGGARLGEGAVSLDGVGTVFAAMTRASGRIPQLSVVFGPAAGGAAYGPALTDIVIAAPSGRIFVTGPEVVRSVTGEEVTMDELGGPLPHSKKSGVVHIATKTDAEAFASARSLAGLLGRQSTVDPGSIEPRDLGTLLPASAARAYDVHPLVDGLLDEPGVELQKRWAPNIVTTLGRFGGRTIGVIANNPLRLGGCLDSLSAEKAARFVRMCDAFGVPLLVVVDVPGYLPGTQQEWGGVVRRGAKLLHAFAESVVPRVTLVTRKAYGGAYIAMNSRALGATSVFAWPETEIAVMGAVAAVRILHRRTLATVPESERGAVEERLALEHQASLGGLQGVVDAGIVDEIIEPHKTRERIAEVFAAAPSVRGWHGNIPL